MMDKDEIVQKLARVMQNTDRPFLLFSGPSGTGKTYSAQLLSKILGYRIVKSFKELEDSMSIYSDDPVIVMLEELQGVRKAAQEHILDQMNRIEDNNGKLICTDPNKMKTSEKQIIVIICTTDKHKILDPIVRRCKVIDYPEYSLTQIQGIAQKLYKKVDATIIKRAVDCCKLNIRTALSLIEDYLTFGNLDEVLEIRCIDKFGLSQNDKRYLYFLSNRGKMSVDELTSVLSLPNNSCVKQEIEPYFRKMLWVSTETKGRTLTSEGKAFVLKLQRADLDNQRKEN